MSGSYSKLRLRGTQPTTHARVKHPNISNSAKLILLKQGNREVVFQADVVEQGMWDLDEQLVAVHKNIRNIINTQKGHVQVRELTNRDNKLQRTEKVQLRIIQGKESVVRSHFSSGKRLVRPITEMIKLNGSKMKVEVVDTKPATAPAQTYVINPEKTDIEYLSEGEYTSSNGRSGTNQHQNTTSEDPESDGGQPYSIDAPEESLEDVAGLEPVKDHVRALIELYRGSTYDELTEKYSSEIISREDTLLLYGPPGCGKTMVSEAIANEFKREIAGNVVFMTVKGSDILSKHKGESEKKVKKIFTNARREAGENGFTVLFFDEVENLVHDRSSGNLKPHQVSLTNAFLQEMNDIGENLIVIGATNMPFKMDSAASRRFHTKLLIRDPGPEAMAEVWREKLEDVNYKNGINDDSDYKELGEKSSEFTPAEIVDQILGSTVQTELVHQHLDGQPKKIDKKYLMNKLEDAEPRSVPEYVSKVRSQMRQHEMEGYDELKQYVKERSN